VRYNLALALDRLSRDREAEASLLQALQLDPGDGDIVYALAAFYVQRHQWKRALPFAEQLVALSPADPRVRQLLEAIKRQLASSG
jgi:Flp pilus assembly protein TadD